MAHADLAKRIKNNKDVSPNFLKLFEKVNDPCDLITPNQPPSWLSRELFQLGERFYEDWYFSVALSSFANLLLGFSVPNLCYILVLTGKSETLTKAFIRYGMTAFYLDNLYKEPPWEKMTSVKNVNGFHSAAAKKFRGITVPELQKKAEKIILQQTTDIAKLEHLDYVLLNNFKHIKENEFQEIKFEFFEKYVNAKDVFTQFDMAMVQSAFFASLVVFPKLYGVETVPKKWFEGLMHIWRIHAYNMGVEDQANLVKDSYDETIELLHEIGHRIIVPATFQMNEISVIMGKNVAKGIGLDYHVLIYIASEGYGIILQELWHEFSIQQKLKYCLYNFFVTYLCPNAIFRYIMNKIMKIMINYYIAKAKEMQKV